MVAILTKLLIYVFRITFTSDKVLLIFLKLMCLLIAIFLQFIFNKKSMVLFGPSHSLFFSRTFNYLFRKNSSLKIVAPDLKKKNFQF